MDFVTNELKVKHTTCKLINEATMQKQTNNCFSLTLRSDVSFSFVSFVQFVTQVLQKILLLEINN